MPGYSEANLAGVTNEAWSAPYGVGANTITVASAATGIQTSPTFADDTVLFTTVYSATLGPANTLWDNARNIGGGLGSSILGQTYDQSPTYITSQTAINTILNQTRGYTTNRFDVDQEDGALKNIPSLLEQ